VREKITDPAYSGWFLKFKPGGSNGTNQWHTPPCSSDKSGTKCSELYHDLEQTPQPPLSGSSTARENTSRTKHGDWYVYNSTNDVCGLSPGTQGVVNVSPQPTWEDCLSAADKAAKPVFGWWPASKPGGAPGCFLADSWKTPGQGCGKNLPIKQANHVSGFKPKPGQQPPPAIDAGGSTSGLENCATGVCDCGEGLPCGSRGKNNWSFQCKQCGNCSWFLQFQSNNSSIFLAFGTGEYLWDHRNGTMLRDFLVDEFVLGPNGLANPASA
jgi:hypothetical protein